MRTAFSLFIKVCVCHGVDDNGDQKRGIKIVPECLCSMDVMFFYDFSSSGDGTSSWCEVFTVYMGVVVVKNVATNNRCCP